MFQKLTIHPVRSLSIALLAASLGVALTAQAGDPGLNTIRADSLKGHIFFLASDEMGGRDSLSPEGRIAAGYIAGFFHRAGLKPVGDRGTYFQNFPMSAGSHRPRPNLPARHDRQGRELGDARLRDGAGLHARPPGERRRRRPRAAGVRRLRHHRAGVRLRRLQGGRRPRQGGHGADPRTAGARSRRAASSAATTPSTRSTGGSRK